MMINAIYIRRIRVTVYSALFAAAVLFATISAAGECCPPRDVWLLSTRCAPHCGPLDNAAESIRYSRLSDDCCWTDAGREDFQADPATPTVVYIHGNRTHADAAATKGMYAYRSIRSAVGCRPFRFVIWSWPAGRICSRPRNDIPMKADISDVNGYYLAVWLDSLPPKAKVSLIGHSFGPRIIGGALELLAGGEITGRKLPREIADKWRGGKRNPIRVVFLAAAADADWLAPCGRYANALSLVDDALVTENCCDRALQHYPRMDGRGGPEAMGLVGPYCVADSSKVHVVDVSCTVGKPHDWRCYCSASNVVAQWARYTFLDDPQE